MDAKTNGALPAHPTPVAGCTDGGVYNSIEQSGGLYGGLTKRELFAAMAMQGMCASNLYATATGEQIAAYSTECADALLAALAREATP